MELNPPPALTNGFLRPFHCTGNACASFGFSFADDGVGSVAFLFHQREGFCSGSGQQGSLFAFEWVDDHAAVLGFLQELGPIRASGEEEPSDEPCCS